ncbi:MAG TPA: hypothetical protein VF666_01215 [Pyrinomonadaceae bacterium]
MCFSFIVEAADAARVGQVFDAGVLSEALADEDEMLEPSDFFKEFPEIKWGMSYQDARKAIEKRGHRPIGFKGVETEVAWNGKFNEMEGRGTIILKEGAGVVQISVVVHAFEKKKDLFEAWQKRLTEKYGAAKDEDTSVADEKLWRLKNGFVILIRSLKEAESPVVVIQWVKE